MDILLYTNLVSKNKDLTLNADNYKKLQSNTLNDSLKKAKLKNEIAVSIYDILKEILKINDLDYILKSRDRLIEYSDRNIQYQKELLPDKEFNETISYKEVLRVNRNYNNHLSKNTEEMKKLIFDKYINENILFDFIELINNYMLELETKVNKEDTLNFIFKSSNIQFDYNNFKSVIQKYPRNKIVNSFTDLFDIIENRNMDLNNKLSNIEFIINEIQLNVENAKLSPKEKKIYYEMKKVVDEIEETTDLHNFLNSVFDANYSIKKIIKNTIYEITENNEAIFLSIKPKWMKLIKSQEKTYEFRNKIPKSKIKQLYIYESTPIKQLKYIANVEEPVEYPELIPENGIGNKEFNLGVKKGRYAYRIVSLVELINPIKYEELKEKYKFIAPQSFIYTKKYPELIKRIMEENKQLIFVK